MQCDIDWGVPGIQRALVRGDVIIIVDTLSFSSAVVTAVHQGVIVYISGSQEEAETLARDEDAILSVARDQVNDENPFSLSPITFLNASPDTRVVLASRNGASCMVACAGSEHVYVGCLLNAQSIAAHAAEVASAIGKDITIIAAGEYSQDHGFSGDPHLLFAVEDYLGCGAILNGIMADYTAEASVCANAFLASQEVLEHILCGSISGMQLISTGFESDVTHSAQLNQYTCVPHLRGNRIVPHDAPEIQAPVQSEPIAEAETDIDEESTIDVVSVESQTEASDMADWPEELIALRDEALECTRCALAETRTNVVFGEGNPKSRLVLVGEGPGDHEDRTGRPFVGRAGQLLDEALAKAGIQRDALWICNVLKCRACIVEDGRTKNRAPRADEIKTCQPWLEAQLRILQPSVILCIGAPAANLLIHKGFKMTQEHGQWFTECDYAPNIMAALHPAYILRQHGEPYESALQSLVDDLAAAWARSQEPPAPKPQLTLF